MASKKPASKTAKIAAAPVAAPATPVTEEGGASLLTTDSEASKVIFVHSDPAVELGARKTVDKGREQHSAWCRAQIAAGWAFGHAEDAANKTSPLLVDFDHLTAEQRAKYDGKRDEPAVEAQNPA